MYLLHNADLCDDNDDDSDSGNGDEVGGVVVSVDFVHSLWFYRKNSCHCLDISMIATPTFISLVGLATNRHNIRNYTMYRTINLSVPGYKTKEVEFIFVHTYVRIHMYVYETQKSVHDLFLPQSRFTACCSERATVRLGSLLDSESASVLRDEGKMNSQHINSMFDYSIPRSL